MKQIYLLLMEWVTLLLLLTFGSVVTIAYRKWLQHFDAPSIGFSRLADLGGGEGKKRRYYAYWCLVAAVALAGTALCQPRIWMSYQGDEGKDRSQEAVPMPTEGIAVYLVLDRSSSMLEPLNIRTSDGEVIQLSRMEFLKRVTSDFVKGRKKDLVGLVGFARVPEVMVPLTLDHPLVLEKLEELQTVSRRDQDGTAMGYALFKTVHLIAATRHFAQELIEKGRPAYDIKSNVVVLVTDGIEKPSPLDRGNPLRMMFMAEALRYALEHEVRVYVVNIEPAFNKPQFKGRKEQLQQVAESTGGQLFVMDGNQSLQEIYEEIDTLEASRIPGQEVMAEIDEQIRGKKDQRPFDLYPYFLGLALLFLGASITLETLLLRRAP